MADGNFPVTFVAHGYGFKVLIKDPPLCTRDMTGTVFVDWEGLREPFDLALTIKILSRSGRMTGHELCHVRQSLNMKHTEFSREVEIPSNVLHQAECRGTRPISPDIHWKDEYRMRRAVMNLLLDAELVIEDGPGEQAESKYTVTMEEVDVFK